MGRRGKRAMMHSRGEDPSSKKPKITSDAEEESRIKRLETYWKDERGFRLFTTDWPVQTFPSSRFIRSSYKIGQSSLVLWYAEFMQARGTWLSKETNLVNKCILLLLVLTNVCSRNFVRILVELS